MQVVTQDDPVFARTLADFSLAYDLSESFGEDFAGEQLDILSKLHPERLSNEYRWLLVEIKRLKP